MSRKTSPSRRPRVVRGLLLVVSVALAVGCGGDPSKPRLGRVSGKVTYNGAPVPKGIVSFVPASGEGVQTGQSATGEIGSDGSYRLTTFENGDGAVLGEHIVTVQAVELDPALEGGTMPMPNAQGGFDMAPPKHLVPEKYGSPQTTPLRFTVAEGRSTFDIELTD